MHNDSFLPARRSMRGICYIYGNVAGWVSVTRRHCIKTAKPILKLFRPSGSPIILVSSDPYNDTQFQGEPLQRGLYIHGHAKNWRFSTEIAVYLGNGARYRPWCILGTLIRSRGCRLDWYHFRSP